MITETMCAFMAQFEKNLNSGMSIETAIEIACDFGAQNGEDYDY